MDSESKTRPFYILQILKDRTDENHFLSTNDISRILLSDYNIKTHRVTINQDIKLLQDVGYDIQRIRSSQNKYNFVGRDFEIPELQLLIDAVESSKLITKKKSDYLVKKIAHLGGTFNEEILKSNIIVDKKYKPQNEQIYYIIDAISDAINRKKKIVFQKAEYNIKKERILHNGGESYVFSPYCFVWDGDYYYVIGFSDKYQSVGSHRIDRIYKKPEIIEESSFEVDSSFNANDYINTMFHMFDVPRKDVELICKNYLMDTIVDRFGIDVETYAYDLENFKIVVNVADNKLFYNWVFGFEGDVLIKSPDEVKKKYESMVENAYKTNVTKQSN